VDTGAEQLSLTDAVRAGQRRAPSARGARLPGLIGAAVSLTLTGGVVAAVIGSGSARVHSPALSPSVLAGAGAAARGAGTVRFSSTSTVKASGKDLVLKFGGVFDNRQHLGAVDVTVGDMHVRSVVTSTLIYLQYPETLRAQDSHGKAWLSAPLASLVTGGAAAQLGQNPTDQLDVLKGLKDPQIVGRERIDGVDTTEFRGTLDLSHVYDSVAPALRARLQPPGTVLNPGVTDVWVGSDELPRRLVSTTTITVSGATAEVRSAVDYSGYGQPVSIAVPDPADVYAATSLPGL